MSGVSPVPMRPLASPSWGNLAQITASLRIAAIAVRKAKTRTDRSFALRRCDILLDRYNLVRQQDRVSPG